ncbi:MAG: crossover junction endodeoxyribonuclease RuvC [Rhodospirillales bacterium]|nr:crossover junction endodeoxyribonuclease RuvC [Rhodospirillales bacterium]
MFILGIDPGLQKTGWGIIESHGSALKFIASGLIKTTKELPLSARLAQLDDGLAKVLKGWNPDTAAVEETFVNKNPASTLKLGQARGVCLLAPARTGLIVHEYATNLVKKSIVGNGHASKDQMGMMIRTLLPASGTVSEDEADALAVAICHAHFSQTAVILSEAKNLVNDGK